MFCFKLTGVAMHWRKLRKTEVLAARNLDTGEEAFGSHFVSYATLLCSFGKTSETRWRRPWFCTLSASSLEYPGL